jgi:SAM-dependent methyltransferase
MPAAAARHAPATDRNRAPILGILRDVLPPSGLVLEVASGTGQHVRYFAEALPGLDWQPSDPDQDALASIAAWSDGVPNIRPPLLLDAGDPVWPLDRADAILCINMVHISPWSATKGLFAGAARLLGPGAPLYLYGPYRRAGVPTAESNEAFDTSLKARNSAWGLRQVEDVAALADATGFVLEQLAEMPANNLSLVFRRAEEGERRSV